MAHAGVSGGSAESAAAETPVPIVAAATTTHAATAAVTAAIRPQNMPVMFAWVQYPTRRAPPLAWRRSSTTTEDSNDAGSQRRRPVGRLPSGRQGHDAS